MHGKRPKMKTNRMTHVSVKGLNLGIVAREIYEITLHVFKGEYAHLPNCETHPK